MKRVFIIQSVCVQVLRCLFVLNVGALVKTDEQEVINFLLTTEIIPLCLRIMESGSELSKTVRSYSVFKIVWTFTDSPQHNIDTY